MKTFTLRIVTPNREIFNGEVEQTWLPGAAGYFGVLADHAPLLALLDAGAGYFKGPQSEHILAVTGGYAEISENVVTVLARSAEFLEEIDADRADKARGRAADRLSAGAPNIDRDRARSALRRAQVRLNLIRAKRRA
ncbi:ATP synthase F1 subunit epsilon [bacterium]|nr:ATP synthase F1 subunit epsilon [bacterium]